MPMCFTTNIHDISPSLPRAPCAPDVKQPTINITYSIKVNTAMVVCWKGGIPAGNKQNIVSE